MEMESLRQIRIGLVAFGLVALVAGNGACASAPEGVPEPGREPITVHVDNMTSRVITVDRIVATQGSPGSTPFGEVQRQNERPITRRVGLVQGGSKRTMTVAWHPSQRAHEILWLEGVARIATGRETLGPGQHHSSYVVEQCLGEGPNACSVTSSLHLPPGAEVTLVIDKNHVARMYYQLRPEGS